MVDIVKQVVEFYLKNNKIPEKKDLVIIDKTLENRRWNFFVTIYKSGEVSWSAWNIKELKINALEELIANAIEAVNDKRFSLTMWDLKNLEYRVDEIVKREVLWDLEIFKLDPFKKWVIAIKKDREKMAVILPNISPLLLTGEDLVSSLGKKLWEEFDEKNYDLFSIETVQKTSF